MKQFSTLIIASIFLLPACSIQQTYYDAELAVAADDKRKGNYEEAHENLVSAVWRAKNHLGPKEVSTAYYNLGLLYREQANFEQAISVLLESVKYAKQSGSFDQLAMGRRYIELAISHAALDQWESGIPYLKEVAPYWDQYRSREAQTVNMIFSEYAKALSEQGVSTAFIPNKALQRPSR